MKKYHSEPGKLFFKVIIKCQALKKWVLKKKKYK